MNNIFGNFLLIIFTMKISSFTIKKNDFRSDTGISSETTIPGISSETTETRDPPCYRVVTDFPFYGFLRSGLDIRPRNLE